MSKKNGHKKTKRHIKLDKNIIKILKSFYFGCYGIKEK